MTILAVVKSKNKLAEGIFAFGFEPAEGETFPPFTAGAHIDIHAGAGLVRQYSLYNHYAVDGQYQVGVQRELEGRGGSKAVCDNLSVGDTVTISEPRNHFELDEGYDHYILMGGGIGITPILAMAEELNAKGKSFELHYCVRDESRAAFKDILLGKSFADKVSVHLDNGPKEQLMDFGSFFKDIPASTQVYMCGPGGFMGAIDTATAHWPKELVRREYFSAPAGEQVSAGEKGGFTVTMAKSGKTFEVAADKKLSDALREAGFKVSLSCAEGFCGSCLVNVISGEIQHNDLCLSDAEKKEGKLMTPCVSRGAPGTELVLDI